MRRWMVLVVTIGLLALSWAALDDITTNRVQENFQAEYLVVVLTALWCSVLAVLSWRRARRRAGP